MKAQAQIEVFFMLTPFLAGWAVFIYYWVFLLWNEWDALPAPCVIMCVGYLFYFRWKNQIIEESGALDALTFTVRWEEGVVETITNVIEGWMDLSEAGAYENGTPEMKAIKKCPVCGEAIPWSELTPKFCGNCKADLPTSEISEKILGDDKALFTKIKFGRRMIDKTGLTWFWAVFIHTFPKDQTFKKVPGQWFTHKGLMFLTSTGNIDVTYVGAKEEVHHVKYFLVTSCPERTRRIQLGIGLTPATADVEEINKARDLSSIRTGIKWMLRAREAEGLADVVSESSLDTKTKSYKGANRILDDLDGMRERRRFKTVKTNWKKWVVYLAAGVAVIWFAWSMGWLNFSNSTSSPVVEVTGIARAMRWLRS